MSEAKHDPIIRAKAALADGRRINDANALDMIDAITALRAEVERLTRERDACLTTCSAYKRTMAAEAERDRLAAENARLRKAFLHSIQLDNHCDDSGAPCAANGHCGCECEMIAALASQGEG